MYRQLRRWHTEARGNSKYADFADTPGMYHQSPRGNFFVFQRHPAGVIKSNYLGEARQRSVDQFPDLTSPISERSQPQQQGEEEKEEEGEEEEEEGRENSRIPGERSTGVSQ